LWSQDKTREKSCRPNHARILATGRENFRDKEMFVNGAHQKRCNDRANPGKMQGEDNDGEVVSMPVNFRNSDSRTGDEPTGGYKPATLL